MDLLLGMKLFSEIAEEGSFAAVAKANGMNPSGVSRTISALEKRLKTRLLNRTTRNVSLTETGSKYLEHVKRVLEQIEDAENCILNLEAKPQGNLRMTIPVTFGTMHIAPLIPKFLNKAPDISVDLSMTDSFVDLVEERVDVAIRVGELKDSSLVARKLANNERLLVASPGYLKRHGTPKNLLDLKTHDCLLMNAENFRSVWNFRSKEQSHRIEVKGRYNSTNSASLLEACLKGFGIGYLPYWLTHDSLESGRLVNILSQLCPRHLNVQGGIYAVYPTQANLPLKVRSFVDFVVEEFSKAGLIEKVQAKKKHG